MMNLRRWQTGTALLVAWGLATTTIAPLTLSAPAVANSTPLTLAQLFPDQDAPRRVAIPAGTRLPVRYDEATKKEVSVSDTVPLTFVVSKNIRASSGDLLIPAWSEVRGRLRPVTGGSQFFAEELVLTDGTSLPISATSQVIATNEVRQGADSGAILKGAAIGAAGATVVSGVTGKRQITVGKVLLGAGAGALGGLLLGKKQTTVVTINPYMDVDLTLNSSLALR